MTHAATNVSTISSVPAFFLSSGILAITANQLHDCIAPSNIWLFFAIAIPLLVLHVRVFKGPGLTWIQRICILCGFVSVAWLTMSDVLFWVMAAIYGVRMVLWRVDVVKRRRLFEAVDFALLLYVLSSFFSRCYAWSGYFLADYSLFNSILRPIMLMVGDVFGFDGATYVGDGRSVYRVHLGLETSSLLVAIMFGVFTFVLRARATDKMRLTRLTLCILFCSCSIVIFGCMARLMSWHATLHPFSFVSRTVSSVGELMGLVIGLLLLGLSGCFEAIWHSVRETGKGVLNWTLQIAAICLAASVTIFFFWHPEGTRKSQNRVLIDDSHSRWERSDIPFDFSEEGLTRIAGYSYTCFARLLSEYYQTEVNHSHLDMVDLQKYGVLVLKTPSDAFSPEEREAIDRYVRDGGSLFVHSDHTDLFGISSHLNPIVQKAGVRFRLDDQANYFGLPSRWNRYYRSYHSSIADVRSFQFLTSCTIELSNIFAEPVLCSKSIFSEDARYFRPGFFGDMHYGPADRPGEHVQAAIVPYGMGRIAAFSDSTVFSNFAISESGYSRYAIGTMEYLMHRPSNYKPVICITAMVLGLLVIGVAFACLHLGVPVFLEAVCHLTLGFAIGLQVYTFLPPNSSPERIGESPMAKIVLGDVYVSNALDPVPHESELKEFSAFTSAFMRAGFIVELSYDEVPSLDGSDTLVVINPIQRFSSKSISKIREFLLGGGCVVVVDTLANTKSTSAQLLKSLGSDLKVGSQFVKTSPAAKIPRFSDAHSATEFLCELSVFLTQNVSVPINPAVSSKSSYLSFLVPSRMDPIECTVPENIPTVFYRKYAKGSLYFFSGSERFSHGMLGRTGVQFELTEDQKKSHAKIDWILSGFKQRKPYLGTSADQGADDGS